MSRHPSNDTSALLERIVIDPEICHGKPVLRGLRYPVETILELMSSGMSFEEILEDYPDLEREDLLAALVFATQLSRVKRLETLALPTTPQDKAKSHGTSMAR